MEKSKGLLKCLSVLFWVATAAITVFAIAQKSATSNLKIVNKTRALEVVNAEFDPLNLTLTFKNNYDQRVIGVVVSVQKNMTEMVPFPSPTEIPASGGTRKQSFHLLASGKRRDVVVLAAM